nr:LysR substrate-binding domain-containing protein [Arenicellales bacterium]
RTNKSVTITSIGKDIAAQARLALKDLEGLVELAGSSQSPLCGKLNMGIIPTIAPFLLPRLLPRIRRTYPQLKLYLHEDQTLRIYNKLIDGDLDIVLIALPYPLHNVESMRLFNDSFHLAYRQDTKLFDPDSPSIDQLPKESILLLEDGHCLREHAMTACKLRNVSKISTVRANSLLTLVEMVDADLGVTYLPEMATGSFLLKHTRVKTQPIKTSGRGIGLMWRKGSVRSDEFKELGAFIRDNK